MSSETHRDRLYSAVTRSNVEAALIEARKRDAVGRCISEEPGSGPSSVYFIADYDGYQFPAKAVMRYAMRLGGFEPKRDDLDFIALDAKSVLGNRHGFEIIEIREGTANSTLTGRRTQNRQKRLAEVFARPQQARFRSELLEKFNSTCVISGAKCPAVLQAAHVIPVSSGGTDEVGNGLLLRADIHLLFDLGLMWIDERTAKLHLGKKLHQDYAGIDGMIVWHPVRSQFLSNLRRRNRKIPS